MFLYGVFFTFFVLTMTIFPLFIMAHAFLYFPAKANGHTLSFKVRWKLVNGLRLYLTWSMLLLLFSFIVVIALFLVLYEALLFFSEPYADVFFIVFTVCLLDFIFPLTFCGVLSGYYLWVRENRMPKRRETTVPDDPFSDDGWGGPIWEDFR